MRGVVFPFGGAVAPRGFLMCEGQAVSRTAYAALFATITLSATGNTTNGSASVTVASTTNLQVGMPISGPGIQSATTITAINIGTSTLTLSKNATATASGVVLVVAPHGVGDGSTTFNVPDLRGEFIRGLDRGRGADPARVLGSRQKGSLTHWDPHSANPDPTFFRTSDGTPSDMFGVDPLVDQAYTGYTQFFTLNPGSVSNNGGLGITRPRNVSMNYIIKT
ncbi:tail collar domain protein [Bordetella phage vB_BbrM_PHB04]|uniref:Tail collar domain protein n=1 Tax=Bordetella phage vB_BbrM_PHB04 TaxID=2029657 RepID=A0A291LAU2_9CAUD|nr:tail fiber protein [Bordetella phage vB_BbrM_PHB04]ATI15737.1 tail collar domain protein [Bordetella phage vB_BbrM_PHB04]